MSNTLWTIRRDGLWLVTWQSTGVREFLGDGRLVSIPTCIYSADRRDAKIFDSELRAREVAAVIGGDVMKARMV